jgi:hypothetical protein
MGNCGPNTLAMQRPTQPQFDALCAAGGVAVPHNGSGCGNNSGCSYYVEGGNISTRRNREGIRQKLEDYALKILGAPVIQLELDQQQVDEAIDDTLDILEDYAPREFFDYYTFKTTPGKSVYKMPDDIGIIRNVFYKEQESFAFQASSLDGAIPVEYFYPGGAYASIQGGMIDPIQPIFGRAGEWMLYKSYQQMFSRMSSNIGGWEWISDMGYVKLYPTPCNCTRVIVHYLQKCKDWKKVTQAMREGVLCRLMINLGHIRGRITNPPGPNGGVQLDHEYMKTKGWELKKEWEEKLLTHWGDINFISMD